MVKKKTDMKFTILTDCTVFLSVEFSSVKNTHIVEQPISTFSFCKSETLQLSQLVKLKLLYPLNSNSPISLSRHPW